MKFQIDQKRFDNRSHLKGFPGCIWLILIKLMFRDHHMVVSRNRLPGAGWSSRHHMTSLPNTQRQKLSRSPGSAVRTPSVSSRKRVSTSWRGWSHGTRRTRWQSSTCSSTVSSGFHVTSPGSDSGQEVTTRVVFKEPCYWKMSVSWVVYGCSDLELLENFM